MASDENPLGGANAGSASVSSAAESRVPVRSYGDVGAEYSAACEQAGLVALPERDLLVAAGPKRQAFLQGMLSNDVASLRPGQGCRAALLSPKGAVQALVRALVEDDAVALEVDAERLSFLQRTLERHRVAAPVRFAPRPTSVLAVLGPRADDVVRTATGALPPGPPESHVEASLAGAPLRLVRAGDLPLAGIVLHLRPEDTTLVWDALRTAGARATGRDAVDALRVESLRPWYGSDVTEANLLHETGLVAECHSPTKGCYVGQEIVARLAARGANVNKSLRRLALSAPARAGDAISKDGQEVGRVTTAAVSPRLGPVAMGYVHRSAAADGTRVLVAGAAATVVLAFEGSPFEGSP